MAGPFFDSLVTAAASKFLLPAGGKALFSLISNKLGGGASDEIEKALKTLFLNGKLADIPLSAVTTGSGAFQDTFLNLAKSSFKKVLEDSGKSDLAIDSKILTDGVNWINKNITVCGVTEVAKADQRQHTTESAASIKNNKAVVFWIEEKDGEPLLPKLGGREKGRLRARSLLVEGLTTWRKPLGLVFQATENESAANLLISGKVFGADIDLDVLALTDVGPLNDHKCRMVFDLAEEKLTDDQFRFTAAHEFGHALGVKHADVGASGFLMSSIMDDNMTIPIDAENDLYKYPKPDDITKAKEKMGIS